MTNTITRRFTTVTMTLLLLLGIAVCGLVSGCAGDKPPIAKGKVDSIIWTLDGDGCLTFSGHGALPGVEYAVDPATGFSQTVCPAWYDWREQVTDVVITGNVDGVSMNAFMYFDRLETLDVGAAVLRIDGYAVTGCPSLERVTIRGGDTKLATYCIGFSGGAAEEYLYDIQFIGVAGSPTERYAEGCGASFKKL